MDEEKRNIYKEIVKKLGLLEDEIIPEKYSNDIVKDYFQLKRSIDIVNKEIIT